jgi:ribosomal protein S20
MPVTKTAKRALRSSGRKALINVKRTSSWEIAVREVEKKKTSESLKKAFSLLDRASKNKLIHKNKASRIKSRLNRIVKVKPSLRSKTSGK